MNRFIAFRGAALLKTLKSGAALLMALAGMMVISTGTMAAPCYDSGDDLLGIPPWYKYLDGEDVEVINPADPSTTTTVCQPVIEPETGQWLPIKDILLIVAAVLDMLIRIAGVAAFIYLLYGGFMYLTSSGSPENVKKAGQTLLNAAIGLAIAISAAAIINFVARRF